MSADSVAVALGGGTVELAAETAPPALGSTVSFVEFALVLFAGADLGTIDAFDAFCMESFALAPISAVPVAFEEICFCGLDWLRVVVFNDCTVAFPSDELETFEGSEKLPALPVLFLRDAFGAPSANVRFVELLLLGAVVVIFEEFDTFACATIVRLVTSHAWRASELVKDHGFSAAS